MAIRTVKRTNVRDRAAMDPSVPGYTTSAVVSSIAATAADTIEITFATRVMLRGTPNVTAGAAVGVSGATQVSATVIQLQFAADVQGTDLVVPEGVAGVRTPSGGFIPAGTYAIPTFP